MNKLNTTDRFTARTFATTFVAATLLLMTGNAQAQQVADTFVFPSAGQNQNQQAVDSFQCQSWARDLTGFDPMRRAPAATEPPPQSTVAQDTTRGLFTGVLAGAALGAVVDGQDGAGKGALAGGVLGGLTGNARGRSNTANQRSTWEQRQAAEYDQQRSNWNRAFAVCMEGRDYTVR
ncbi:MAG: hypothetical protein ACR2QB_12480 [Gammaproteobacteria bacterium]